MSRLLADALGGNQMMRVSVHTRFRKTLIGSIAASLAALGLTAVIATAQAAGGPPSFVQQVNAGIMRTSSPRP